MIGFVLGLAVGAGLGLLLGWQAYTRGRQDGRVELARHLAQARPAPSPRAIAMCGCAGDWIMHKDIPRSAVERTE